MMATVSGICFLLAVFLAPQQGLIPRAIRRVRLSLRILEEDILADLFRGEEAKSIVDVGTIRFAASLRHSPARPVRKSATRSDH